MEATYLTVVPLIFQTGFEITLTQLDGVEFQLKLDEVIECDQVLRVPGKGMPRRSGRGFGDLYITFEVEFPDKLSGQQKAELRRVLGGSSSSSQGKSSEL